jgi:hypothetical protein
MSHRAIFVRMLTALHAALGRWLAGAEQSATRKSNSSWFGCDPDSIRTAMPRDPDDELAERLRRNTFRIGPPLP